jgi:hypothetical protein
LSLGKTQQQTKRIAVRRNGVRTGASLRHQALSKEAFEQYRKIVELLHGQFSQRFSRHRLAKPINCGWALKYQ